LFGRRFDLDHSMDRPMLINPALSDDDYARKVDELERLLNDPAVPMEPARVWSLLAELSGAGETGESSRGA
jgi:hypothetical protein